jgi:quaternary ammonium compound-resistance protein SugE
MLGAWALVLLSGALQVGWLVSLREIGGFRRLVPLFFYLAFGLASTWCFSRSLEKLPLSTAYAVWTGVSVAGSLAFDLFVLKEPPHARQIACILLILAGTAGLKLAGAAR